MYSSTTLTIFNNSDRREVRVYLKRTVCMYVCMYVCVLLCLSVYTISHNNLYLYFYNLIIMKPNDASMEAFQVKHSLKKLI
jgi:hypothetical protein